MNPTFWPQLPVSPNLLQANMQFAIHGTIPGDADITDGGVVVEGERPEALHLREPHAPRLHAVQGLLVDLK